MGQGLWETCKRARQESVHLLSSPSGFQGGSLDSTQAEVAGGPRLARGAKLARRVE